MADHDIPVETNKSIYRQNIQNHIDNAQAIVDRIVNTAVPQRADWEKDMLPIARGALQMHKWVQKRFFT